MKVVPQVPFGARGCSVLPSRTADPEGFIAGQPCRGCGITQFISAEAVRIMGDEFGMASKTELLDLRFRLHESEKERDEALDTIARNERLEQELVEARETIAERDEILTTLEALADQGLTTKQVRGTLDRFARLKDDLVGAEDVVAALLETVTNLAALKDGRKKVTA